MFEYSILNKYLERVIHELQIFIPFFYLKNNNLHKSWCLMSQEYFNYYR
jgi:hypothetical protein